MPPAFRFLPVLLLLAACGSSGEDELLLHIDGIQAPARQINTGEGDNHVYITRASGIVGLNSQSGDDVLVMEDSNIEGNLELGEGDDQVLMEGGVIAGNISGGMGDDYLNLVEGTVLGDINGGEGDDTLVLGGPVELAGGIAGGEGDDTIVVTNSLVQGPITGGAGKDGFFLHSFYLESYIDGGEGEDIISLAGGRFLAYNSGLRGNDETPGKAWGGAGPDSLTLVGALITSDLEGDDEADQFFIQAGEVQGGINTGNSPYNFPYSDPDAEPPEETEEGEEEEPVPPTIDGLLDSGESFFDPDGPDEDGEERADSVIITGGRITGSITGGAGTQYISLGGGGSSGVRAFGDGEIIKPEEDDLINIKGGAGNDVIRILSGEIGDVHIDGGTGDDLIEIGAGFSFKKYTGGLFTDGLEADADDAYTIVGGEGADRFRLTGGEIEGDITGEKNETDIVVYLSGRVGGNILLDTGDDSLTLAATTPDIGRGAREEPEDDETEGEIEDNRDRIHGAIDTGSGNDEIIVTAGCYASYNAGSQGSRHARTEADCNDDGIIDTETDPNDEEEEAERDVLYNVIFGGSGDDTFTLDGGTIAGQTLQAVGFIAIRTGSASGVDVINLYSGRIAGTIELGKGNDVVSVGKEDGDENQVGPTIQHGIYGQADNDEFTLYAGRITFIDGGSGNDTFRIYAPVSDADGSEPIRFTGDCDDDDNEETTADQENGLQWICGGSGTDSVIYGTDIAELESDNISNVGQKCEIPEDEEDCTPAAPPPSSIANRISGVERVALTPELELWSGLAPAMQSLATELIQPFGEASAPQSGAMAHFFGGEVKQMGLVQTRQSHLRQRQNSRISLGTISGHTLHTQDIALSQQRIRSALTQDWSLGGGLSLAEGTITTNGVGMDLMAYAAEASLVYTGGGFLARADALGGLFEFTPRNHKGLGEITAHQVSVVASLARKFQIGGFVITPAAKLVWHKSDIALTATTPELFTAEAGAALVYAGQHFHARFTHSEGEEGQLGAVKHHAGGERMEFGWQGVFSPAKTIALTGTAKWRRGLEANAQQEFYGGALLQWNF